MNQYPIYNYYYDLSSQLPSGRLEPGQVLSFDVVIARPTGASYSATSIVPYGIVE
ncbi:MAG TPA: hypothetical protein VJB59_10075 [Bdellovibrionota bacterium]|nr:hypothetical protein [Bdellovibrionota bacterium]